MKINLHNVLITELIFGLDILKVLLWRWIGGGLSLIYFINKGPLTINSITQEVQLWSSFFLIFWMHLVNLKWHMAEVHKWDEMRPSSTCSNFCSRKQQQQVPPSMRKTKATVYKLGGSVCPGYMTFLDSKTISGKHIWWKMGKQLTSKLKCQNVFQKTESMTRIKHHQKKRIHFIRS